MRPYFDVEDKNQILSEISSLIENRELVSGKKVKEFEIGFARYIGQKYSIATNSATSALEVSIRSLGLRGKEIIVPTNTFIASPNSVINSGNIPVFADMEEDSFGINLDSVKSKLNKNTKALMVVHIGGLVHPKIEEIKDFCQDNDLYLIEDGAHVIGAELNNKKAGTFGDISCFSFYISARISKFLACASLLNRVSFSLHTGQRHEGTETEFLWPILSQ